MVELRRTYARGAGVSSARACGLGAFPPTFLQYVLDFTVVKARLPSSGDLTLPQRPSLAVNSKTGQYVKLLYNVTELSWALADGW